MTDYVNQDQLKDVFSRMMNRMEMCRKLDQDLSLAINRLAARIDKIENYLISTTYKSNSELPKNIRPHKCPNCEGRGAKRDKDDHTFSISARTLDPPCESCKGEGIVWG
jgi:DnaJ-class molecular chaperone